MKTLKNQLFTTAIFLCGLSQTFAQTPGCSGMSAEHNPDFNHSGREVPTATTSIRKFTQVVSVNGASLAIEAATIKTVALCQLRQDALDLLDGCTGYMTAVKIFYGMSGTNMQYFYNPVLLCYKSASEESGICFNHYTVIYSDRYYTYTNNSNTFTPVAGNAPQVVAASAKVYTQSVRIVHVDGEQPGGWKPAGSETDVFGDAEGLIYTIREMKMAASRNGTETFKLFNHVQQFYASRANGEGVILNKHSLILSGGNSDGRNTLRGKMKEKYFGFDAAVNDKVRALIAPYMNLAHLCPPNCVTPAYRFPCD